MESATPSMSFVGFGGPAVTLARVLGAAALLGALVALLLILASPGCEASIEFNEEPLRVSDVDEEDQLALDLAVGPDDRLYAVWEDDRLMAWALGGTAIFFAKAEPDSRGRELHGHVQVAETDERTDQEIPAISVGPDGIVHVAWQQRLAPSGSPTVEAPWEIWYSRSLDSGESWEEAIQLSQANNQVNTRPDIAATSGDGAYVAWEMMDHRGVSVVLSYVQEGSRRWRMEDFAEASEDWELNHQVRVAIDEQDFLHIAWSAQDLNAMGETVTHQVLYLMIGGTIDVGDLESPVALADDAWNWSNERPDIAVTKRYGVWVAWVQRPIHDATPSLMRVVADHVGNGGPEEDLPVGEFGTSPKAEPSLDAHGGVGESVLVVIGGIFPPSPPIFSQVCSEHGCFADPHPVVPPGTSVGVNVTITSDSLGNAYIGWDDKGDVWLIQRRNSPPNKPVPTRPDGSTHDTTPEFGWTFNDRDAGSSQSAFELHYSMDLTFSEFATSGVVTGVRGRSDRYQPSEAMVEGRWYWRVRTRDQLGLWSAEWGEGDFLLDDTPPEAVVVINDGDEYTHQLVVSLWVNASDNMGEGTTLTYQLSNDPNFIGSTEHEFPPPGNRINHELLPGEGIKVVFFRIWDESSLSYTAMDSIIYNETTVFIAHNPVATAPEKKPLNISCEVLRVPGAVVTLFYRRTGDSEYRDIEMDGNASQYWAVIPEGDVTKKGLDYFIEAQARGQRISSPPFDPELNPHKVKVYETTEEYQAPIYAPTITLIGAVLILVALIAIWYFRIRDKG